MSYSSPLSHKLHEHDPEKVINPTYRLANTPHPSTDKRPRTGQTLSLNGDGQHCLVIKQQDERTYCQIKRPMAYRLRTSSSSSKKLIANSPLGVVLALVPVAIMVQRNTTVTAVAIILLSSALWLQIDYGL